MSGERKGFLDGLLGRNSIPEIKAQLLRRRLSQPRPQFTDTQAEALNQHLKEGRIDVDDYHNTFTGNDRIYPPLKISQDGKIYRRLPIEYVPVEPLSGATSLEIGVETSIPEPSSETQSLDSASNTQ